MATLYGAWAFNEGSGSTIIDYSGNNRNMSMTGSNSWVTGKYYTSAFLSGSTGSDSAAFNNGSADPALSGDVSCMVWYQHVSSLNNTSHAAGLYGSPGTSRISMYSFRNRSGIASSPHITGRDSTSATVWDVGINGTNTDSGWHHVAFVYHASGSMDMYLDGTLLSPSIANPTTNPIGTTVQEIATGGLYSGTAQAAVQDLRVFAGALTASDVTTYMNTPVAGGGTVSGTAALSGSGTITAAGQKSVPGAASLSGSGTISAAGQKLVPGAAALGGSGTITATGQKQVPGTAALAGAGTFTATGQKTVPGAASLGGSGTLSGSGAVNIQPVSLAGTGALGATASVLYRRSASLSGSGTIRAARSGAAVNSTVSLSAGAVLTCSSLSARIVMAANTMFPANQLGTYGAAEAETTVTVPGIIDGIYA